MRCFFDGSETHGKRVTLAVVAATEGYWARSVEPKWLDVRAQHKAPAVHMTDLVAKRGDFEGWDECQVFRLSHHLINTLEEVRDHPEMWGAACTVDVDAHSVISNPVALVRRDLPAPERICAYILFPRMHEWFLERPVGPEETRTIDVTFDQGEAFRGHIIRLSQDKRFRRTAPGWGMVRSIGEADYRFTPGLEIADMATWAVHRLQPPALDDAWTPLALRIQAALRIVPFDVGAEQLLSQAYIDPIEAARRWRRRR